MKRPHELLAPRLATNRLRMPAVLLLALIAARHAPRRIEIRIEDLKFKPATIQISSGDTIVWINNDDSDHEVKSDDGSFNSGRLSAGGSFEHHFDKVGRFDYRDELHPRMHGVVVVDAGQ